MRVFSLNSCTRRQSSFCRSAVHGAKARLKPDVHSKKHKLYTLQQNVKGRKSASPVRTQNQRGKVHLSTFCSPQRGKHTICTARRTSKPPQLEVTLKICSADPGYVSPQKSVPEGHSCPPRQRHRDTVFHSMPCRNPLLGGSFEFFHTSVA